MEQHDVVCCTGGSAGEVSVLTGLLKRPLDESSKSNGVRKRVRSLKNAATGSWEGNILRMTKIKGSFWRIMGHDRNGMSYLYPEEALYLLERKQLIASNEENNAIALSDFYQAVTHTIPLACYLTYVKLKVNVLDSTFP